MSAITIVLFFLYSYGIGFSATSFLKEPKDLFEKNIMRIGVGLAIVPFLLVLLDFTGLPVDWRIVLLLSLISPAIALFRQSKEGVGLPKLKLRRSHLHLLIVFLIFFVTLFMYVSPFK